VTNMNSMFSGCNNLTLLDLSGFDTSKVTYMGLMFRDCSYLTAIHVSDRWDTSSLTHGYYKPGYEMFTGCRNLKGGNGTKYSSNNTDAAYARIDKAGQPGYLTNAIITVEPKNTAAAEGNDAVFTLTASGSGLTYQWQYYHEGKAVWAASGQPGADTPTLTVAATPARNGQKYRCIVKQPNGKKTVSRTAVLTVYGEGEITAQPQSVTLDHLGETVAFRVVAWGRNPAYQWQVNTGTGWRNSVLDGCRTDTLSVEAKKYRDGYQYRCVITSLNGQTVSEPATLSFVKLAILRQPVSQSVMYGQTAQLQISAKGTNLRYQWQYNFGSGWRNATAEGCNTDTMPVFAYRYRDGYRYRCVVTAYDGRIVSDEVTLRASQIQIVKQPEDVNLTWWSPDDWQEYGFMSVSATGTNLYYQWQKNDGSGWKNTGASSPSLKVWYEYSDWGIKYRCIVKPDKDSNYFAVTSDVAYLFCDSAGMSYDDY
ncbi:MAG: BspA family leucine-rich repeat surface protein, partial [Oscillospiraceae bacterium]|nr:BspA family leucine-rich repeat surface protein [Oscillospiraceae bacterium]